MPDLIDLVAGAGTGQWRRGLCVSCGRPFTSLGRSPNCGSAGCLPQQVHPRRKIRIVTAAELMRSARSLFQEWGFVEKVLDNVVLQGGSTDLVVAALQVYEASSRMGQDVVDVPLFVPQPSVRLRYLSDAAKDDTVFATSFVNMSTTKARPTEDTLVTFLNAWLQLLSRSGCDPQSLTLVSGETNLRFAGFEGTVLDVNCNGIEIGEVAWFHSVPAFMGPVELLEFGFGLERVLYAINRPSLPFSAAAGYLALAWVGRPEAVDAVRTLVLLAMCGLRPDDPSAGFQMRRLAALCVGAVADGLDISQATAEVYSYWTLFLKPRVRLDVVERLIEALGNEALSRALSRRGVRMAPEAIGAPLLQQIEAALKVGEPWCLLREALDSLSGRSRNSPVPPSENPN